MSPNSYDPNSPHQQPIEGGLSANHQNEASSTQPPAPRRRWLWILCGVFGLGTLGLVICCGVGSIYFSRISTILLDRTRGELNELTQVQSQCGEITELSMNFAGTLEEAEVHQEFVILDAVTEAGPFQFSVQITGDGSIDQAYLILEDGTRQELDLSSRVVDAPVDSPPASQTAPINQSPAADSTPELVDETERELRRLESELDLN